MQNISTCVDAKLRPQDWVCFNQAFDEIKNYSPFSLPQHSQPVIDVMVRL